MGAVEALREENRGFSGAVDLDGFIFCGCGAVALIVRFAADPLSINGGAHKGWMYFDLPNAAQHYPARFMLYVVDVKRDAIPAITHVDGTGDFRPCARNIIRVTD